VSASADKHVFAAGCRSSSEGAAVVCFFSALVLLVPAVVWVHSHLAACPSGRRNLACSAAHLRRPQGTSV